MNDMQISVALHALQLQYGSNASLILLSGAEIIKRCQETDVQKIGYALIAKKARAYATRVLENVSPSIKQESIELDREIKEMLGVAELEDLPLDSESKKDLNDMLSPKE